ncbi:hypothetical protein CYY_010287, partial [Polysphondylium violaceum]
MSLFKNRNGYTGLILVFLFFVSSVNSQAPNVLGFKVLYETYYSGGQCVFDFEVNLDVDFNQYTFSLNPYTSTVFAKNVVEGKSLIRVRTETGLGNNIIINANFVDALTNSYQITLGILECIDYPANLAYQEIVSDYPNTVGPQEVLYFFRISNFAKQFSGPCYPQSSPYSCSLSQYAPKTDPSLFLISIKPITASELEVSNLIIEIFEPIGKTFTFTSLMAPFGSLQSTLLVPPPSVFITTTSETNTYILFNILGDYRSMNLGLIFLGQQTNGALNYKRVKGGVLDSTFLIMLTNSPSSDSPAEDICEISFYNGASKALNLATIHNSRGSLNLISNVLPLASPFPLDNHSNFINVSFLATTYTQDMLYTLIDSSMQMDIKYPFGYKSGNLKTYTFEITELTSKYEKTASSMVIATHSTMSFGPIPIYSTNPIQIDTTPPVINDIQTTRVNNSFIKISLNITDDISGFAVAILGGPGFEKDVIEVLPHHIVKGDLNNGVFEIITDTIFKLSGEVSVADRASNNLKFQFADNVYNVNGKSIDLLQDKLSPETITLFYFEKPIVDVSQQGQSNTLYLNFIGAGPHSKVFFDLLLNTLVETVDIYDQSQFHYWDPVLNLIKIDFYLPKGLASGELNYLLQFTKPVTSQLLSQILGSNSTLTIAEDVTANQLPPLVTKIIASQPFYMLGATQNANIGWSIEVETPKHRLKSALFTVTSDYDPVGVNYTFNSPIFTITNNFVIDFQVSGDSRSQIYTISYAYLEDDEGLKSGFRAKPWTNAFFQVEIPSITVTCPLIIDSQGPTVLSFERISPQPFNPLGSNRKLKYEYEAYDPSGILERLKPSVFLNGRLNTKSFFNLYKKSLFECETSITFSNSTNVRYESTCDVPYGLGYPDGLLVSVYGFVDKYMNVFGLSSQDLQINNYEYYLNGSVSTPLAPIIESINNFNGNGKLELHGSRFGSSGTTIIEIKTQGTNSFTVLSPSFHDFSSVYISFDYQSADSFYIRIKNEYDTNYSNEYYVQLSENSSSSPSSSSSSHS